jgi:hypothetical protein
MSDIRKRRIFANKNISIMKVDINTNTSNKPHPTITLNEVIKGYNNDRAYNMEKYDYRKLPSYSLLLSDDEIEGEDVVKGIIEIEKVNAPKDVFLSSLERKSLNLENVVQFEITHIDIPLCWTTIEALNEIFCCLQHDLRQEFYGKKVVVVWFEFGEYFMRPVSTNINEEEYQYFAPSMAELFWNILNKL